MLKKIIILLSLVIITFSCSNSVMTGNFSDEIGESLEFQSATSSIEFVQLIKADSTYSSHYGIPSVSRFFEIRVKDIAYNKSVAIHHAKTDGTWVDVPAVYYGTAGDGYQIWKVSILWNAFNSNSYLYAEEFVVKYTVDNTTYWDNNNNSNYSLAKHGGILLGNDINVLKNSASKYNQYGSGNTVFYGSVDVKNISYDKVVKIVFSTDNWYSTQTVNAQYTPYYGVPYSSSISSPNAQGIERWTFSVDLPYQANTVSFVVAYEVADQTNWDNNYSQNYTITD